MQHEWKQLLLAMALFQSHLKLILVKTIHLWMVLMRTNKAKVELLNSVDFIFTPTLSILSVFLLVITCTTGRYYRQSMFDQISKESHDVSVHRNGTTLYL